MPWPCPVCTEVVSLSPRDCPHCQVPAAWIDLLNALDFAIRRFHWWSLVGTIDKQQYRVIVDYHRRERQGMAQAAQAGEDVPLDTGLPPQTLCPLCGNSSPTLVRRCPHCGVALDTSEARQVRYQTYLRREIEEHGRERRLGTAQVNQMIAETMAILDEQRGRLRT